MKSTTPIGDDLIISAGLALSYTDVNKPASGIVPKSVVSPPQPSKSTLQLST